MSALPTTIPGFAGPLNPVANISIAVDLLERTLLAKITEYNRAAAFVRIVKSRGIRDLQDANAYAKAAAWVNANKAHYDTMMKNIDLALSAGGSIAPGWANQWNSAIGVAVTTAGQGLAALPALVAVPAAVMGSVAARYLITAAVACFAINVLGVPLVSPGKSVVVETKPDGTRVTTTATNAGAVANAASPLSWLPLVIVGGAALWLFSRRR